MGSEKPEDDDKNVCQKCAEGFQRKVIGGLESFFFKYGFYCAKYPWAYIVAGLLFCVLCCAGLANYYEETDGPKLWLPSDSQYKKNSEWIEETFPSSVRTSIILIYTKDEDGNILEAENIREVYELRKKIGEIKTDVNSTWESVCLQRPVIIPGGGGGGGGGPPPYLAGWYLHGLGEFGSRNKDLVHGKPLVGTLGRLRYF